MDKYRQEYTHKPYCFSARVERTPELDALMEQFEKAHAELNERLNDGFNLSHAEYEAKWGPTEDVCCECGRPWCNAIRPLQDDEE